MASLETIKLLALDAFSYDNVVIFEHAGVLPDGSHRHGAMIVVTPETQGEPADAMFIDFSHTVRCCKDTISQFATVVKESHGKR